MQRPRPATAALALAATCMLTALTTPSVAAADAEVPPGMSRASSSGEAPTPWGAVTALLGGSGVMTAAGVLALGRQGTGGARTAWSAEHQPDGGAGQGGRGDEAEGRHPEHGS